MGRYVPALCFLNLVLLIASTACLYLSSIMINIYLLPSLGLITSHFTTVPYLILAIGGLLLLISIFGIVAALVKSRVALVIYALLVGVVFILELASIFTSMELRNELERKVLFQTRNREMDEEMKLYWVDEYVKFKWDTLQRDFQCCGGINLRTGFQDWNRGNYINQQQQHGVPESCCIEEGCDTSSDIFSDIHAYEKINIHGCLAIMKTRLFRDIYPVLLTYLGCVVVLALLTILAMVLAAAYVASITRDGNDEKEGMGMYPRPGPSRYEEPIRRGPPADTLDSGLGNGSLRSVQTNQPYYQDNSPPRTPFLPVLNEDSDRTSVSNML